MTSLSLNLMSIHIAQKAQIALLVVKKVKISNKYLDLSDVFLKKKILILLEIIELNQHAIELQKDQQSLYRSIHSLGSIKLKILKKYIKSNLASDFI